MGTPSELLIKNAGAIYGFNPAMAAVSGLYLGGAGAINGYVLTKLLGKRTPWIVGGPTPGMGALKGALLYGIPGAAAGGLVFNR